MADLLVEIHTEELPPKALHRLANSLLTELTTRLQKAELAYDNAEYFATPRRLAVIVKSLAASQPDAVIERKGPALEAAFDSQGNPTPACAGFARSCGVTPKELMTIKTDAGAWVGFQQKSIGKSIEELAPDLVQQSLAALPIPKRMRWGNSDVQFVRPVHSVILLYGQKIIEATILGCKTGRKTRGHRFLSTDWLDISEAAEYEDILEKKGFVIADFVKRKNRIREQAEIHAKKTLDANARVLMTDELLDEVTGLVEWPHAIAGKFDPRFLEVPQEALISAMQVHQRYFPVLDNNGKLRAEFIAISNIQNSDMHQVIEGNERVLRARLSDADFFFTTDKKTTLFDRLENLKNMIFQAKLGTLHDKSLRLSAIAEFISQKIDGDDAAAKRAGLLAKTDLTTELVGEFPELQGIAGYYYALADNEGDVVARALNEQYMPRFSGDALPETSTGIALALADRLDNLIGAFGINQFPTGDKDPLGLRRAALGVLRIIIDKKLRLDLKNLLQFTVEQYQLSLENPETVTQVLQFILERLRPWYQEKNIPHGVYASVAALNLTQPFDIDRRVDAVQFFKDMGEAESLAIANKRISNILSKYTDTISAQNINPALFQEDSEKVLAAKLKELQIELETFSKKAQYKEMLLCLAKLCAPVDHFFDHVMVMTDDKAQRENRILLLKQLRESFLQVADIALLQ